MSDEVWKEVPGTNGYYEASTLGRIRRVKPRILKPNYSRLYPAVGLYLENQGSAHTCAVHALVMATFVGPRPRGYVTNHKDGNKRNPALENLEYVTESENGRHAFAIGLARPLRGEDSPCAKLTHAKAATIRERSRRGELNTVLANEFGVSASTISKVIAGLHWGPAGEKAPDLAKRGGWASGRVRAAKALGNPRCPKGHFYTRTPGRKHRFCRVCSRRQERIRLGIRQVRVHP